MIKQILFSAVVTSVALLSSALSASAYEHEWENPTVFERGKEQPHAWFKTSHTKLLNGKWRFHYADDIKDAPADFYRPGFDDSKWAQIPVPSNWELMGFGAPLYANITGRLILLTSTSLTLWVLTVLHSLYLLSGRTGK